MESNFEGWIEAKLLSSLLAKFLDSHFISDKISHLEGQPSIGFKVIYSPFRTSLNEPFNPDHAAVVINRWIGRFGNNVIQLRSAYLLAKLLGVQTVIAPVHEFFQSVECENISWCFGTAETDEMSVVIIGDFFPHPFNHYHTIYGGKNIGDFYHDLRPACTLKTETVLTERDLVLFIRSGDIFTINHGVISSYGQPPLSFYEAVIEIEQPERIFVLAEDDANPVTRALMEQGRPNIEIIRLGMRGDFEFMLGAKNIATGTTTLMPNLLNLSTDIQRCYTFENWLMNSFNGTFKIVNILDGMGYYKSQILNNNWTHSPAQLALMVDYPMSNLILP